MTNLKEHVEVVSRRGHFNFANPAEESVSTHIAIVDGDGKKKMSCNIRTSDEVNDNAPAQLAMEIWSYLRSIFYSTDDENIKSVRQYLIDNEDDLYIGNLQQEAIALEKKHAKIHERLAAIGRTLSLNDSMVTLTG